MMKPCSLPRPRRLNIVDQYTLYEMLTRMIMLSSPYSPSYGLLRAI